MNLIVICVDDAEARNRLRNVRYAAAEMPSPITASEAGGTEEIIVTAQRRNERLQDVPITIANITADQIRQSNVRDLSDIARTWKADKGVAAALADQDRVDEDLWR